MPQELTLASVMLALGCVVALLVLIARRLVSVARDHRATEERLRPIALAVAFEDESEIPVLSRRDGAVFVALLLPFSARLTGASRERITKWLEQQGHVRDEIGRLSDRRFWRRATAAYVLGDMGSISATPALIRALRDTRGEVRSAAARSLGQLAAPEGIQSLVAALVARRVPRGVVAQALLTLGPAAVPHLLPLLGRPQAEVRASAAELIGLLGDAGEAERLVDLLTDPSEAVRERAAVALGRLGASAAFDDLERALADGAPPVRAAVAEALGMIGDARAFARLLDVARTDVFEPAEAAARALARLSPNRLEEAARDLDAGPYVLEAADAVALDAGAL